MHTSLYNYRVIGGCIKQNMCVTDNLSVQSFQVRLHTKGKLGTLTKCVDYAGVLIFKCPH